MKKSVYEVTRFDIDDYFYVEISPNGEWLDCYLCMKGCYFKSFVVAIDRNCCSENTMEEVYKGFIELNTDRYIATFLEEKEYLDNKPVKLD